MKRVGLHISLLALLAMPAMFALGWWSRDLSYGHTVDRLARDVAELRVQHQNDRLIDELRGTWNETSSRRGGVLIQEKDVDNTSPEVEWLLAPERGSHRRVLKAELETHPLGKVTVDATKNPAWIDCRWERDGKPCVYLGIVWVCHGYTDHGTAIIALTPPSWDGDPERPTSFESTPKNGVSVYRLKRDY